MVLPNVSSGDPHVSAHNTERAAINANEAAIKTKITLPSTPQVGALLRWDGTNWVKSVTRLFEGTGNPEGVVAAPVGSRYVDTSGASGAVEYIKKTGVDANDNHGWMLLAADTGFRNISSLVSKGSNGVVNSAYLRRYNDIIDLFIDLKNPSSLTGFGTILALPVGFRPMITRAGLIQRNNGTASSATSITAAGNVTVSSPVASKTDQYNGIWTTRDAWPSALPGVAA